MNGAFSAQVATLRLVPDRRIERFLAGKKD
jgi:hypothetical protein